MHTAFNFPYLKGPWEAGPLRQVIDDTLSSFEPIGVPSTWVLTSHDEIRPVTRYGRADDELVLHHRRRRARSSDLALGTRRARAAAMLMLALPGGAYVYQGEELGLPNVDDLPDEVLQDPMFLRSGGELRGRDGCRVPLPWSGQAPPFGFSPDGVTPWLPQPESWRDLTVEAQDGDPASMLTLYRAALRLRRETPGLYAAGLAWRESAAGRARLRPRRRPAVRRQPLGGARRGAGRPGAAGEQPARGRPAASGRDRLAPPLTAQPVRLAGGCRRC